MSLFKCLVVVATLFTLLVGCKEDDTKSVPISDSADLPVVDGNGNPIKKETLPTPRTLVPTAGPVAPATDQDRLNDAWTATGFTKDAYAADFYNGYICTLSEKTFVGCFFAAQYMDQKIDGEDTILLVKGEQKNPIVGDLVRELKDFAVYKKKALYDQATLTDEQAADWNQQGTSLQRETVDKLRAIYAAEIGSLADVKTSQDMVLKKFSANWISLFGVWQACDVMPNFVGEDGKNCDQEEEKVGGDIDKSLADLRTFTTDKTEKLEVVKDLMDEYSGAMAKIDAKAQSFWAAQYYGVYLMYSADGHARIELTDKAQAALDAASPAKVLNYGIGVSVTQSKKDNKIYFSPVQGGQGEAAGIKDNDRLVSVVKADGTLVTDFVDSNAVVDVVRGPENTSVTLTVEHWDTKAQETFTIVRKAIPKLSYTFQIRQIDGKTYGYLGLSTFMDETVGGALRTYVGANDAKVEGWILDVRDNGGGLVNIAGQVISAFVPKGTPYMGYSQDGDINVMDPQKLSKTQEDALSQKPLIILVNGGSASASEITTGTLQEQGRGIVVGLQSFGKATVQGAYHRDHEDIPSYPVWMLKFADVVGGAADPKINSWQTESRYFFASGRTPEWIGLTPDVQVLPTPTDTKELFKPREKDIFPFSLSKVDSVWDRPQDQVDRNKALTACLATGSKAAASWTAQKDLPYGPDYQILYAGDVANCANQLKAAPAPVPASAAPAITQKDKISPPPPPQKPS